MYKSETYAIHVLTSGFWGTNELKQTQTLKNPPILAGNPGKTTTKTSNSGLKFSPKIEAKSRQPISPH